MLENLESLTDYEVYVEAVNVHGVGSPSPRLTFRTGSKVNKTHFLLDFGRYLFIIKTLVEVFGFLQVSSYPFAWISRPNPESINYLMFIHLPRIQNAIRELFYVYCVGIVLCLQCYTSMGFV